MTGKQRLFVEKYLQCWNATEAARASGYAGNDVTLASVGYENLRKPQILEAIQRRLTEAAMGAEEVLTRLASIARGENSDAKIAEVIRALELLGRHHALFTDRQDVSGNTEIVVRYVNDWRNG